MTGSAPKLRCAVYTRKSSEEGLDQEFNSLDAQREACCAFIASQVGLGWKLLPDRYDDGGISGGTLERPALQRLLQNIRDRKVDVVVVYKIDRLTRSLMDFSKIVEIFDGHGVSFVSVTQQFNTTTSMGRLTLNVLLSFAQFEREVTAERIRDKIAASKKKGLWKGGRVPLGYEVKDRKLLVKEPEASFVRSLFDRYLELRSVPALAETIRQEGAGGAMGIDRREHDAEPAIQADPNEPTSPVRSVASGMLYKLLANPVYIGKVRHHANVYDGEHQPIVATATFDEVQTLLAMQAPRQKGLRAHRDIHLLTGILFDETGDRLSPAHANKQGKRYRYYVSGRLKTAKRSDDRGWRIPAHELERAIEHQAIQILQDRPRLSGWIQEQASSEQVETALRNSGRLVDILSDPSSRDDKRAVLGAMFRKIVMETDAMRLSVDARALVTMLIDPSVSDPAREVEENNNDASSLIVIVIPMTLKRRGNEARLIVEADGGHRRLPDKALVDLLARAHLYLEALTTGPSKNIRDVARMFGVNPADVSRVLPLAFLAPAITEAILAGHQPAELSARKLARFDMPLSWSVQTMAISG